MPPRKSSDPVRTTARSLAALGRRIRDIRRTEGMTQEALAEAADLHPVTVSNLEGGKYDPHYSTLVALARGLGVDLKRLV